MNISVVYKPSLFKMGEYDDPEIEFTPELEIKKVTVKLVCYHADSQMEQVTVDDGWDNSHEEYRDICQDCYEEVE